MVNGVVVQAVNNFGDTRSGGLAGPMGLFIIVLLSIATVLLIRNMNKRLRRLPDSFPDPAAVQRAAEVTRSDVETRRDGDATVAGGVESHGSTASEQVAEVEVKTAEDAEAPRGANGRGEPT